VPAAIASIGLSQHVLSPSVATAIVAAGLVSLVVSTLGVERLVRGARAPTAGQPTTAS
jgi:hypothetical protein